MLPVAQGGELAGLFENRGVRRDSVGARVAQVVADFDNEIGNVIEQAVGRKDASRVDRQHGEQTLEPSSGQRRVFGAHALSDCVDETCIDHLCAVGAWWRQKSSIADDSRRSPRKAAAELSANDRRRRPSRFQRLVCLRAKVSVATTNITIAMNCDVERTPPKTNPRSASPRKVSSQNRATA